MQSTAQHYREIFKDSIALLAEKAHEDPALREFLEAIQRDQQRLCNMIDNWNEEDIYANISCGIEALQFTSRNGIVMHRSMRMAQVKKQAKVIEYGVADGTFTLPYFLNQDYYGVEISPLSAFLARLTARKYSLEDRIIYTQNTAFVPDKPANVAFAKSVLHEADNPLNLLATMRGAVRQGGKIVIIERITPVLETAIHYQVLLELEETICEQLSSIGCSSVPSNV